MHTHEKNRINRNKGEKCCVKESAKYSDTLVECSKALIVKIIWLCFTRKRLQISFLTLNSIWLLRRWPPLPLAANSHRQNLEILTKNKQSRGRDFTKKKCGFCIHDNTENVYQYIASIIHAKIENERREDVKLWICFYITDTKFFLSHITSLLINFSYDFR